MWLDKDLPIVGQGRFLVDFISDRTLQHAAERILKDFGHPLSLPVTLVDQFGRPLPTGRTIRFRRYGQFVKEKRP